MNVVLLIVLLSFTAGLVGDVFCSEIERAVLAMQLDGCPAAYAYSVCGDKLTKKGDYKSALKCYDKAIQLKSGKKNIELYLCTRGFFFHHMHNYSAAQADFTQAIRANPKYACSYAGRGSTRLALDDLPGALKDYEQAGRLEPTFKIYCAKQLVSFRCGNRKV
ncbi:MAG: hypothetical protein C0507_07580 [Cyanobacteria bacterium PR.3.49]|nr:hypothetical protein [Cyanobacteria bacterium PR.3.49]